ncbi:hypothetical protein K8Q94_00140 [Candidatus Nomurabacteria bacterium]|nr:hypothetical protein [Candidatus Nomurabacteria bacterium]
MKKAHFIGICGKGMSALAFIYKKAGYRVTGSDEGFYDPIYSMLKKAKIKFYSGHKKGNIPKDADEIIIGKHAKLTKEENEEVAHAFMTHKNIMSLPEALGRISIKKENTVVVGSFGKSTITSLLSWCLLHAKKDPSFFIGAVPLNLKTNARLGKSKDFIIEGDEYPSSNWDSSAKFLHMHPKNCILISGEHDHINVFPTEKDYVKPYIELMKLLPENGLLIANKEGKNVMKISEKSKCRIVTYGKNKKAEYYPENIKYGLKTSFDLFCRGKKVITLETILLGEHNIENITAVCAFILEKKLLNKEELKKGIKSFKGISGRLDLKNKNSIIPIYEGFGSSYSKAKSVFDALKLHFSDKKIITIFEPHTFSWRNRDALKWYKNVFHGISEVILLPPPEHGANTHNQLSYDEIFNEIKKYNSVHKAQTEKEALNLIRKITTKENIIVLVSSGSLFGLTESVPKLIKKLF